MYIFFKKFIDYYYFNLILKLEKCSRSVYHCYENYAIEDYNPLASNNNCADWELLSQFFTWNRIYLRIKICPVFSIKPLPAHAL